MQDRGQFFRKIPCDRVADESFSGGQQGTVAGEPGRLGGPHTIGPEMGDLTKGVETAAMKVAGQVVELFELSENGKVDIRAEGTFQVWKCCDIAVDQQRTHRIRQKREKPINRI